MARHKVALTKSVLFRGQQEEFSNVYIMDGIDGESTSFMSDLIDDLVAAEKLIHSTDVAFVRAQIWDFENIGQNYMPYSAALSGYGSVTPTSGMYRECAIMLRARLPRTTGGGKSVQPYLRKYFHCCALHGRVGSGGDPATWSTPPAAFSSWVALMAAPASGVSVQGNEGTEAVGAWEICNHVEHRQFHRGRKET